MTICVCVSMRLFSCLDVSFAVRAGVCRRVHIRASHSCCRSCFKASVFNVLESVHVFPRLREEINHLLQILLSKTFVC